jgi:hypothetical protein
MRQVLKNFAFPILVCFSTALLSGCFDLGDPVGENDASPAGSSSATPPPDATPNTAPVISGNPSSVAMVGNAWSFTPTASDADGDTLTFDIDNLPVWAEFNNVTGQLSGVPQLGQEGSYDDIRISASDGQLSTALPNFTVNVQNVNTNTAPVISGSPVITATVGQAYLFTPSAADADNDVLTFNIANQPGWATFDSATGQLAGTPQQGDSAVYPNIVISVNDGEMMASLPAFSINVSQAATSSVTLNWTAPTQNEDGSPLIDLAAYKIYYGLSEGNYPNEIRVDNPGITTYVVDNLTPNTYFFVSTSINSNDIESAFSNVASKIVN